MLNEDFGNDKEKIALSVVLPCFNESAALPFCLRELREVFYSLPGRKELIIVDNSSSDNSREIILKAMVSFPELRLLDEKRRGYGSAYLKGLAVATGEKVFMADADGSYDFKEIPLFLMEIDKGNDLVIGNRFSRRFSRGVMSFSHRYIGNPVLSFLVRFLFKVGIKDIHCGARAFKRKTFIPLNLYSSGMEFASEMVIRASRSGLKISEIPVSYRSRLGESKLVSWRDGWRHLRLILLYSPFALFFLPGIIMFLSGFLLLAWFYFSNPLIFGLQFFDRPMFVFSLLALSGYQLLIFGGFAKIYAVNHLGDYDSRLEKLFRFITLERGVLFGLLIFLIGLIINVRLLTGWVASGFGPLRSVKELIIALTLLALGVQSFFSSFMFSILSIRGRK